MSNTPISKTLSSLKLHGTIRDAVRLEETERRIGNAIAKFAAKHGLQVDGFNNAVFVPCGESVGSNSALRMRINGRTQEDGSVVYTCTMKATHTSTPVEAEGSTPAKAFKNLKKAIEKRCADDKKEAKKVAKRLKKENKEKRAMEKKAKKLSKKENQPCWNRS